MLVLTFERFLCALNPLKYKAYLTKRITLKTVITCWCISIITGVLYGTLPITRVGLTYSFVLIGVIFLILSITTYTIISYKIRRSQRNLNRQSQRRDDGNEAITSWKHYVVAIGIIASFVFFYMIPMCIKRYTLRYSTPLTKNKVYTHELLSLVVNVGLMSDACVYIFLTKRYREFLLKMCFCRKTGANASNAYNVRATTYC